MNDFVICATRSMKHYASLVSAHLGKFPNLTDKEGNYNGVDLLEPNHFADGEMEVNVNSSIRGKDVFIFSSSARNDAGIGVSNAKIELYHSIDALKRSHARKITVFEPFITCSRSDRNVRRSSVGLWVHIKTLVSLGASHIITYQLHSDKSKSMVDPAQCALDDIPALNLLEQYLCDNYVKTLDQLDNEVKNNWAFCSVDAGGEKIARVFANAFGAPLVIAHKQRNYSRANSIDSIHILSAEPVKGKILWIVDDMVDTAGSVVKLIDALVKLEPKEINLITVHALLSNPAIEKIMQFYNKGMLNKFIVTDTICCKAALQDIPCLESVPSIGLSAKIINTVITNSSMSKILRPFNAHKYLQGKNDLQAPSSIG